MSSPAVDLKDTAPPQAPPSANAGRRLATLPEVAQLFTVATITERPDGTYEVAATGADGTEYIVLPDALTAAVIAAAALGGVQ